MLDHLGTPDVGIGPDTYAAAQSRVGSVDQGPHLGTGFYSGQGVYPKASPYVTTSNLEKMFPLFVLQVSEGNDGPGRRVVFRGRSRLPGRPEESSETDFCFRFRCG